MIKTIDRNLLEAQKVDAIAHCCNCQNVMGAGIAASLRRAYPEIYEADTKASCGGLNKLGGVSIAKIENPKTFRYCFNLYGQDTTGGLRAVNYEAIYAALEKMRDAILRFNDSLSPRQFNEHAIKNIAFPYKMGCGLAGGDFRIIEKMIEVIFENSGLTVIFCRYEPPTQRKDLKDE